jgi:L-asparaginase
MPDARPRIDYLATGGTIASVPGAAPGVAPTLTAAEIARSVDGIDRIADLRTHQFLQGPSAAIGVSDLLRMRDELAERVADGARGFVLTQGTDTIEETAFVLDLLWAGEAPIVVTGAMRNPSVPGTDGPANILAAVQVAASEQARGLGVLVVLNDEIHAARFVRKMHTSRPSTFASPAVGPIGWVSEGRPVVAVRPLGRPRLAVPTGADVPPVALVRLGLGDDGRLLSALVELGFRGAVIEAFGGGHVAPVMVPLLQRLATEMPVVLASRTGSGEVLSETYRFTGSEIELLAMGLIRAGMLDGLKARLLLTLCLAAGCSRAQIVEEFRVVGMRSAQTA